MNLKETSPTMLRNPLAQIQEGLLLGVVEVQTGVGARLGTGLNSAALIRRGANSRVMRYVLLVLALCVSLMPQNAMAAVVAGCTSDGAEKLFGLLNSFALGLIGVGSVASILMFSVGALMIMFSAGNQSRASKGLLIVKNTVIALLILGGGIFIKYVVLSVIQAATGSFSDQQCTDNNQTTLNVNP